MSNKLKSIGKIVLVIVILAILMFIVFSIYKSNQQIDEQAIIEKLNQYAANANVDTEIVEIESIDYENEYIYFISADGTHGSLGFEGIFGVEKEAWEKLLHTELGDN